MKRLQTNPSQTASQYPAAFISVIAPAVLNGWLCHSVKQIALRWRPVVSQQVTFCQKLRRSGKVNSSYLEKSDVELVSTSECDQGRTADLKLKTPLMRGFIFLRTARLKERPFPAYRKPSLCVRPARRLSANNVSTYQIKGRLSGRPIRISNRLGRFISSSDCDQPD